jgi:two-component system sensor kinase FixL
MMRTARLITADPPDNLETAECYRQLQENEYRLLAILDNAAEAIVCVDSDGAIIEFNRAAERMFGLQAQQVAGQDINTLLVMAENERAADFLDEFLRQPRPRSPWRNLERLGKRHDGSLFPLELAIGEIDSLGQFSFIIRDLSEYKRLEQQVLDASTMEQEHLGHEIHDGLGQQLTALDLLATSLARKLERTGSPEAATANVLAHHAREALAQARCIARGLAPVEIDPAGLSNALVTLAENNQTATGIQCHAHIRSPVMIPDSRIATHLYRIAQEAVTNAVKHSGAHTVELSLRQKNGQILLCVQDDGSGLPANAAQRGGLGLHIMRYRANLIGAQLSTSNTPTGSRVCCTLPM